MSNLNSKCYAMVLFTETLVLTNGQSVFKILNFSWSCNVLNDLDIYQSDSKDFLPFFLPLTLPLPFSLPLSFSLSLSLLIVPALDSDIARCNTFPVYRILTCPLVTSAPLQMKHSSANWITFPVGAKPRACYRLYRTGCDLCINSFNTEQCDRAPHFQKPMTLRRLGIHKNN